MSKVASEKSNGKASRLRDSRRHLRRVTEESEGEEREHVLDQVAIAERFLKAFARSELDYAGGAGVPREGYAHHVAERVARRLLEDLAWPRTPSVMSAAELAEALRLLKLAVTDRPPVDPAKLAKAALERRSSSARSSRSRASAAPTRSSFRASAAKAAGTTASRTRRTRPSSCSSPRSWTGSRRPASTQS